MHRYLAESEARAQYRSYADIESSGLYVNALTVLAGLVGATTAAVLRFARLKSQKLAAGGNSDGSILLFDEADAQLLLSAKGDRHRLVLQAGCACAVSGLAAILAQLTRIYNTTQCFVRVQTNGDETCQVGPPILEKIEEVAFHPHMYLSADANDGEGPGIAAYVGAVLLGASLALSAFGFSLIEHWRDELSRRTQRIPKVHCVPAGGQKLLHVLCGPTKPMGELIQHVVMLCLLVRWFLPERSCSTVGGVQSCVRHWPWEMLESEPSPSYHLTMYGKRMGQVAGDLMALSLIPVPKNSLILPAFGIPFERALWFHRLLGQGATIATVVHMACFFVDWSLTPQRGVVGLELIAQECFSPFCDYSTPEEQKKCDDSYEPGGANEFTWLFDGKRKRVQNFMGIVAGACFVLMLMTSLEWVRRNHFEVFYKTHIVCAIGSFVGMYHHFELGKLDVAVLPLMLIIGDYALRVARSFRGDATIVSTKVFGGEQHGSARFLSLEIQSERFKLQEPGQYFFLRIPSIAALEWHPFSVSSAPEEASINIVLKDLGDWTRQLCATPSRHLPLGEKIRLDGPYGRLTVPVYNYDAVLLCCGGIGCTPMFAVLNSLSERMNAAAADSDADAASLLPRRTTASLPKVVWLIWSVREQCLIDHYMPKLIEAQQHSACNIRVYVTGGPQQKLDPEKAFIVDAAAGGSNAASVGFRRSADLDNRADDAIENGTRFEALSFTDDWVQVAEEKWLPRKFCRKEEVPHVAAETDQQAGSSAMDAEMELQQPFVGQGRPNLRRIVSTVDQECANQVIGSCAVLACGPTPLLDCIKDAIAQTKTETSFEFHQETFEF